MSFSTDGYLGVDAKLAREEAKKKYKEILEIANTANRLAYEMMQKLYIPHDNPKLIALGALYIKIIQSFQSTIILFEYGLSSDAKSISRILIESTMNLVAICDNEKFAESYLRNDAVNLLGLLKDIRSDTKKGVFFRRIFPENEIEKIKNQEEICKEISIGYKVYKKWQIAEIAKMEEYYRLPYQVYNSEVHSDISSAKNFLDVSRNKYIIEPNYKHFYMLVGLNINVLMKAVEALNNNFKLTYKERIFEIVKETNLLIETNKNT